MSKQAPLFTQAKVDRMRRLVDQYGITVAAEIAGTSANAIRIVRRRGWTVARRSPAPRPIPHDFAIQSARMTLHQMARHYGAGVSTISKWAAQVGRAPMRGEHPWKKHPPVDLAARLACLGHGGAAKALGVSSDTMRRWRREAGLTVDGKLIADRSAGWVDRRFGRAA